MTTTVRIAASTSGFAEDKDAAREIRVTKILPLLEGNEKIVLDFGQVQYATQSFIHALIGEPLKKYQDAALEHIEFKNCSPQLKSLVSLVVDYSLGGFLEDARDAMHGAAMKEKVAKSKRRATKQSEKPRPLKEKTTQNSGRRKSTAK